MLQQGRISVNQWNDYFCRAGIKDSFLHLNVNAMSLNWDIQYEHTIYASFALVVMPVKVEARATLLPNKTETELD